MTFMQPNETEKLESEQINSDCFLLYTRSPSFSQPAVGRQRIVRYVFQIVVKYRSKISAKIAYNRGGAIRCEISHNC